MLFSRPTRQEIVTHNDLSSKKQAVRVVSKRYQVFYPRPYRDGGGYYIIMQTSTRKIIRVSLYPPPRR